MILHYEISKEVDGKENKVCLADITMLCLDMDKNGRPTRIPASLVELFEEYFSGK